MSRPTIVLVLSLCLIAGVSYGVIGVVLRTEAPPASAYTPKPREALTQHLLFVVVDGLRYDVATDPARMPRFSDAMKRHSSAEIWAGRVSMTTSAILTYGAGQRGQLEQVVRNLNPAPPPFNSWLENARADGLVLMAVGDPAWTEMFGPAFHEHRPDPKGVAIDFDFNDQTFRDTRDLLQKRPNFLVAHFVTPDHQAHAHGIHSEKYREHMRGYDRQLSELLGEVGPEWTVVVTSDHGAADSGTHGADVPIQRRAPIYAYGPGIAKGVHPSGALDQVDLPNTLAALLGTAAPKQSRGRVLTAWLDLDERARAALACDDAARIHAYGVARLGAEFMQQVAADHERCSAPGAGTLTRREQVHAATRITRAVDAEISSRTGLASTNAMLVLFAAIVGCGLVAFFAAGQSFLPGLPAAAALALSGTSAVFFTERLPGHFPNVVRVLLFVLANLLAVWTLVRPLSIAGWFERHRWLAPSLLPGLLVASYPSNTQPQAYVAVAVCSVVFGLLGPIGSPLRRSDGWERLRATAPALSWPRLACVLVALLVLLVPGTQKQEHLPGWLARSEVWPLGLALLALLGWAVSRRIDAMGRALGSRRELALGVLAVAACLVLRRYVPYPIGRAALVVLPVLALALALRGRVQLALLFGLASFAWVSRDREWLGLLSTLVLAAAAGDAWRARRDEARDSEPLGTRHEVRRHTPGYFDLLLAVCFLFGLLFVQRMAIQGHIDFAGLDLAAGAFGDPNVPLWLVGAALSWKYILAEILVVAVFLGRLDFQSRAVLFPALVLTYLARLLILLLQLFFCGGSYWTALRVTSDLPYSLTGLVAVGLGWWGFTLWEARTSVREAEWVPRSA